MVIESISRSAMAFSFPQAMRDAVCLDLDKILIIRSFPSVVVAPERGAFLPIRLRIGRISQSRSLCLKSALPSPLLMEHSSDALPVLYGINIGTSGPDRRPGVPPLDGGPLPVSAGFFSLCDFLLCPAHRAKLCPRRKIAATFSANVLHHTHFITPTLKKCSLRCTVMCNFSPCFRDS